jgi:hypothetical protein
LTRGVPERRTASCTERYPAEIHLRLSRPRHGYVTPRALDLAEIPGIYRNRTDDLLSICAGMKVWTMIVSSLMPQWSMLA